MRNSELNDSVCGAKKGPKLPEKGPNKPKLTCTILKDAAQTFPLEPFTEAASKPLCGYLRRLAIGRGERIRTSGLYVPNVALYQAKLHPDKQTLCDSSKPKHGQNFSKRPNELEGGFYKRAGCPC